MANDGFVIIYRSDILENLPEGKEYSTLDAWVDFCSEVRFADNTVYKVIKGKEIACGPGQSIRSLGGWATRWKWSRSRVKRFFDAKRKRNRVRYENETVTTRITLCDIDSYEDLRNASETQAKRKRNADESHKNKEERKREKEPLFDQFWNAYPRKVSKGAARKAWGKLKPDEALTQTIITAVGRQITSEQWVKDGGQYIPHPATWLNNKRWEDEITPGGDDPDRVETKGLDDMPPERQRAVNEAMGWSQ